MNNPLNQQFYCTVIQQQPIQIIADPNSHLFKFRRPDIYAQIDRNKYTKEQINWTLI